MTSWNVDCEAELFERRDKPSDPSDVRRLWIMKKKGY